MGYEETYYKRRYEVAKERVQKLEIAISDLAIEISKQKDHVKMLNCLIAENVNQTKGKIVSKKIEGN